jgi:hypothetical protein
MGYKLIVVRCPNTRGRTLGDKSYAKKAVCGRLMGGYVHGTDIYLFHCSTCREFYVGMREGGVMTLKRIPKEELDLYNEIALLKE